MKNTVSRFCSVAFVQKRTDQLLHPVTSTYLSVYRLDALPSLADLARIQPSRLFLRPTRSVTLLSNALPRDFFSFFPSTPLELSKTDQYPPPISQQQSDGIILGFLNHSSSMVGKFYLSIHGSLSLQQILFFLLWNITHTTSSIIPFFFSALHFLLYIGTKAYYM